MVIESQLRQMLPVYFVKWFILLGIGVYAFFPVLYDSFHAAYVVILYLSKFCFSVIPLATLLLLLTRLNVTSLMEWLMLGWFLYALVEVVLFASIQVLMDLPISAGYFIGDFLGYVSIPAIFLVGNYMLRRNPFLALQMFKMFVALAYILFSAFLFRELMVFLGMYSDKASGFVFYPMFALLILLPYSSSLQRALGIVNWKALIFVLMLAVLVVASGRRASLLACLAGFVVILIYPSESLFRVNKFKFILVFFLIAGSAFLYLFGWGMVNKILLLWSVADGGTGGLSIGIRLLEVQDIIRMFETYGHFFNVVLGFGYGSLYEVYHLSGLVEGIEWRHHAHSSYAVLLFRNGFFGVILYFILIGLSFVYVLKDLRNLYALLGFMCLIMISLDIATAQYFYFSVSIPIAAIISNNAVLIKKVLKEAEREHQK